MSRPTSSSGEAGHVETRASRAARLVRSVRKKRSLDSSSIFLAASFAIIITEVFCSSFTLYCLNNGISSSIKAKVTVAYYIAYSTLSLILVVNSALSLATMRRAYATEKSKTRKQFAMEVTGEALTMVSGLMWFTISTASVIMVFAETAEMRPFLLFLSIAAPLLGALSSFSRAYETCLAYKKVKEQLTASEGSTSGTTAPTPLQSKKAWCFLQAGLYVSIALFEFTHFVCHVWEASILQGNTHLIFNIQEVVLLGTQVFLACTFIVLEIAKTYLDRKSGAQQAQSTAMDTPESGSAGGNGVGSSVAGNDNSPEAGRRRASLEECSCPVDCVNVTQVLAASPQLSH